MEGQEASGAPVPVYREWQDLFQWEFRQPWDTQEEEGEVCVFRGRAQAETQPGAAAIAAYERCCWVRSLDVDNEVNKAGSSLLFLSRLLPRIYLK